MQTWIANDVTKIPLARCEKGLCYKTFYNANVISGYVCDKD